MTVTFEIGVSATGQEYIACTVCGMISYHPQDITERYCGSCHQFHDIMERALELDPDWTP